MRGIRSARTCQWVSLQLQCCSELAFAADHAAATSAGSLTSCARQLIPGATPAAQQGQLLSCQGLHHLAASSSCGNAATPAPVSLILRQQPPQWSLGGSSALVRGFSSAACRSNVSPSSSHGGSACRRFYSCFLGQDGAFLRPCSRRHILGATPWPGAILSATSPAFSRPPWLEGVVQQQQHLQRQQTRGMAGAWQKGRAKAHANRRDTSIKEPTRMRVNEEINGPHVRLVFPDGTHKVLRTQDARKAAREHKMDLVEVDGRVSPAVCKLIDAGKAQFKAAQREKEFKRKLQEQQRKQAVKEVRFSAFTADHDIQFKMEQALVFLEKGHKVRLVVVFPGPWNRDAAFGMAKKLADTVRGRAIIGDAPPQARGPKNTITLEMAAAPPAAKEAAMAAG